MTKRFLAFIAAGVVALVAWALASSWRQLDGSHQPNVILQDQGIRQDEPDDLDLVIAIKQGNYQKAIEGFQALAAQFPSHPGVQNDFGVAYACQGMFPEAIQQFSTALNHASLEDRAFIYYNLANVLARQGRTDEANSNFRLAEQALPEFRYPRVLQDSTQYHLTVSLASFMTDVYDKTRLSEVSEMDDGPLYYQRGKDGTQEDYLPLLYLYRSPSTYILKALSLEFSSKTKRQALRRATDMLRLYESAVRAADQTAGVSEVDEAAACEARIKMANLLVLLRRTREGLLLLEEAKRVNPRRLKVYEGLATHYFLQRDYAASMLNTKELLRRNPSSEGGLIVKRQLQQVGHWSDE